MEDLLGILEDHGTGVLLLLLSAFALVLLVSRIMRLFNWGRYRASSTPDAANTKLGTALFTLLFKIINEFRHLLALLVVGIFAVALGYALYVAGGDPDELSKTLQAVTSTLGGLVGSIIGYYFGESKAQASADRKDDDKLDDAAGGPVVQPPRQAPPPK